MNPLNLDLERWAIVEHLRWRLQNDGRPHNFQLELINHRWSDSELDTIMSSAIDDAAIESYIGHLLTDDERLLRKWFVGSVDDSRDNLVRSAVPPSTSPYRQMQVALQRHVNIDLAAIETWKAPINKKWSTFNPYFPAQPSVFLFRQMATVPFHLLNSLIHLPRPIMQLDVTRSAN